VRQAAARRTTQATTFAACTLRGRRSRLPEGRLPIVSSQPASQEQGRKPQSPTKDSTDGKLADGWEPCGSALPDHGQDEPAVSQQDQQDEAHRHEASREGARQASVHSRNVILSRLGCLGPYGCSRQRLKAARRCDFLLDKYVTTTQTRTRS